MQAYATNQETLNLLNWHALEELEHKAVAFDVYRDAGGGEALRITSAAALAAVGIAAALAVTIVSMLGDADARRHPVKAARSFADLRKNPLVHKAFRARWRATSGPASTPTTSTPTRCSPNGRTGSSVRTANSSGT